MLGTFDRYVFGQLARRFGAVFGIVVTILMLENTARLVFDLQRTSRPLFLLGQLSLSLLPEHAAVAIPVATFLAIALTARGMALRGEWQVMPGMGSTPRRMLVAPLAFAAIAGSAQLVDRLELVPLGEQRLDTIYKDVQAGRHGLSFPVGEPIRLDHDTTLLVGKASGEGAPNVLRDVLIRRGDALVIATARATLASDEAGFLALRLVDGVMLSRQTDGRFRRVGFGTFRFGIRQPLAPSSPGLLRHRLERMNAGPLWQEARGGTNTAAPAAAALVARVESALFCLLLPLLGVALGVPPRRRLGGPALFVGLVLIVGHLTMANTVEDRFAALAVPAGAAHLLFWGVLAGALWHHVGKAGEGAVDLMLATAARRTASIARMIVGTVRPQPKRWARTWMATPGPTWPDLLARPAASLRLADRSGRSGALAAPILARTDA